MGAPCRKDASFFAVKGRMGKKFSFRRFMEHKNKDEMRKSIDVVQPRFKISENFDFSKDIVKSVRIKPFLPGDVFPAFKG
jgi:hypothetical protein